MLFNSLEFAVFFIIVYSLYLILSHRWQNRMLLIASYVFYGAWDYRFLSLIIISTVLDYICGLYIYRSSEPRRKKRGLFLSVFGNLAILGFFKYYNFFAESLLSWGNVCGIPIPVNFIHIVLPVGISFYTFQTMSYTIDIYHGRLAPTKKFLDFALFVAFFPQLVAGPIERARHLLPQVLAPRKISLPMFYEGCYLIFWGLFQKVFIADNLARLVDPVFAGNAPYNGIQVLLGVYAFAFQIFCDFAGYSNIARGLARCMGFDIMVNFNIPYSAANPREFWQRWHISLSSWLRDYLYIPLGGNRRGVLITYRNIFITMVLGGLWHGAGWTFILWGVYQAGVLIVHRVCLPFFEKIKPPRTRFFAAVRKNITRICFFHVICFGWLIFRARSVDQILGMTQAVCMRFEYMPSIGLQYMAAKMVFVLMLLILVQWYQYKVKDLSAVLRMPIMARAVFYYICFYLLLLCGPATGKEFIYFQF